MKRLTILICFYFLGTPPSIAQMSPYTFGKGFRITSPDSTFYLRFGFRFQNLIETTWKNTSDGTDFSSNFLIRRSRIKFDGYAFTKSLSYKAELGLSNRDIGSGPGSEFNNASNLILDAYIEWEFAKNWNLKFGQFKLPGNRERVISSANLQLVDRSRLNSRFNIDRDFGIELNTEQTLGSAFILKELFTFSQGEGRNVTSGHHDGFSYTWRAELLPFGSFGSKGDYSGSSLFREPTPKLSLGASYNLNKNAVRERGQLGSFIISEGGDFIGKDLKTVFIDMMFKYQGLSIMGEFADKSTGDGSPLVFDRENNLIGTFYTGSAITFVTGYLLKNNVEFVCRYAQINPDKDVAKDESRFTVGLNKFFVGHSLKVQTDVSRIQVVDGDNSLVWRLQMDFHF